MKFDYRKFYAGKVFIITGASSGIGAACARELARCGAHLFLFGRSQPSLHIVSQECISLGAIDAEYFVADVRDVFRMRDYINGIAESYGIDYVIANAGISAGSSSEVEDLSIARDVITTNVDGAINTIYPCIDHMKKVRSGSVVLVSSMAGFLSIPVCVSYSTSKNAIRVLGEGLRASLRPYNVNVTTLFPGYIDTPLTKKNNFYMPFLRRADKFADYMLRRLHKKPMRIAYPVVFYLLVRLLSFMPVAIFTRIMSMASIKK